MKVLAIFAVLFVAAVHANPQFRALRARASGLGGGQPAGQTQPVVNSFPTNPVNPVGFGAPVQPQQYQPQPQQYQPQQYQPQQFQPQGFQPQPYNAYNPSAPRAPFAGFQ